MAPKTAFLATFPPFMMVMYTCEHRHDLQNQPDARKNPLKMAQKTAFSAIFEPPHGPTCEHRRKWPYPPPMLASRICAEGYTTITSSSLRTSTPEVTSTFLRQAWHR